MQPTDASPPRPNLWQRFLSLPNDSPAKAIAMAAMVSVVCALVVSSTVVLLKPRQDFNQAALRQQQMQSMLATLPGLEEVLRNTGVDSLSTHLVELDTGQLSNAIDANTYDPKQSAKDPALSTELPKEADSAGIGRRENYAVVHLLEKQDKLELVVLPVYGKGYQSTIRAWLTLAGDLNTVVAFSIFEQGETPGLGARIEESGWQASWPGKLLRSESGDLALTVVKGTGSGMHEVDGISGATRTGEGISNMLSFWLGDAGFGPFLENLASGAIRPGDVR